MEATPKTLFAARRPLKPVARYSGFVMLFKRFLWLLVAAVIGIVVWITAFSGENGARLVFSHIAKGQKPAEDIMWKPHYQGVDVHNRPYTVIADKATQIDMDHIDLVKIRADMTANNGSWMALVGGSGLLNLQSKELELHDGVDLFYEGGYDFRSDHAHVDIQKGGASGDSHVEGQGPPGTLVADSFSVIDHGRVIRFNGNVKMTLYR